MQDSDIYSPISISDNQLEQTWQTLPFWHRRPACAEQAAGRPAASLVPQQVLEPELSPQEAQQLAPAQELALPTPVALLELPGQPR